MILQDHVIKESCDFKDRHLSRYLAKFRDPGRCGRGDKIFKFAI